MIPSKTDFNRQALRVLKTLEHLRNNGQYSRYNKELQKLAAKYPEVKDMVDGMMISRKTERKQRKYDKHGNPRSV